MIHIYDFILPTCAMTQFVFVNEPTNWLAVA